MSIGSLLNKVGDGAKGAADDVGDAAKGAAGKVAGAGKGAADGIAGAAKQVDGALVAAGHAIEDVALGAWNDLDTAIKLCNFLKTIDFNSAKPVPRPDPQKVNQGQGPKGSPPPQNHKRLAHAQYAPSPVQKAVKMTNADVQLNYGSTQAKESQMLMAIGPSVSAAAVIGVGIGLGFFWDVNGDWGVYSAGAALNGFVAATGVELVFTYVLKGYGFKSFNGPAASANISFGEGWAAEGAALFTPNKEFMGFSVGGGAGAGSPVNIYGSYSYTFGEYLQG